MQKLIVSGINPSTSGVGRLMQRLASVAPEYEYEFIFPGPRESLRMSLEKGKLGKAGSEISNRLRDLRSRNRLIAQVQGARVIAIHPQTLSWSNLFKLIENNNQVALYVMDNSFFCIKSYNHLEGTFEPCFRCIGGSFECADKCKKDAYRTTTTSLRKLYSYKDNIEFFVQNENQLRLVHMHFGSVKSRIVGVYTSDMFDECETKLNNYDTYDVVYHAATSEPKGIIYTLLLAKALPEKRFLVPGALSSKLKRTCAKFGLRTQQLQNVDCADLNWENGLCSILRKAKLVMCPSIWSAPIEGALIKSMIFNGNVAVVNTAYSFAQELPDGVVLKLPSDVKKAAGIIRSKLDACGQDIHNSRFWARDYLSKAGLMTKCLLADDQVTPIIR